jgi:hypothetical protein
VNVSKQLFLTPATNGKPGEVIEVQSSDEGQQYLTPATPDKAGELVSVRRASVATQQEFAEVVPYFAANFPEITELRSKVKQAETALRHAVSRNAPSKEIARLEGALRSLKAEADAAEQPRREERQREQTGTNSKTQTTNKRSFDQFLADLDAKQLAAQRAVNSSPVCCVGAYKCTRCQATAGV